MRDRGKKIQADVLAVLQQCRHPMSAYDIMGKLSKIHPKIAPQTIYRALCPLTESGAVHRLESLNAYVACQHGANDHTAVLSICGDCQNVEESLAPELLHELSGVVGKSGFKPSRHVIEIHGVCGACDGAGTAPQ